MGSFAKAQKQAKQQQLQEHFALMQEKISNTTFTGVSGGGLVTIILNGAKEMKKITIKPECVDVNDIEGLQDLIQAAFESAFKQINEYETELTSGFSLPF